jgi:hypothetical protein
MPNICEDISKVDDRSATSIQDKEPNQRKTIAVSLKCLRPSARMWWRCCRTQRYISHISKRANHTASTIPSLKIKLEPRGNLLGKKE